MELNAISRIQIKQTHASLNFFNNDNTNAVNHVLFPNNWCEINCFIFLRFNTFASFAAACAFNLQVKKCVAEDMFEQGI